MHSIIVNTRIQMVNTRLAGLDERKMIRIRITHASAVCAIFIHYLINEVRTG